MTLYQETKLWIRELEPRDSDEYEPYRSKLRLSYIDFWSKTTRLAHTIASDLPGLTLHDEAHFDALWDRASQLVGDQFHINPLEVYVLGGAILLHDVGHAVAAYPERLNFIKNSIEYKDRLGALLSQAKQRVDEDKIIEVSENMEREAVFFSLRQLHAKQAKILGTQAFDGQYLLDDSELRDKLGGLIGLIAASHHWKHEELFDLPPEQGVFGSFPGSWTISPLKIACILRCADAIQIDASRVPTFAFALQHPSGESRLHWIAQQLRRPVVHLDGDGQGSLSFSSVEDFTEQNADAWWLAFDLIKVANDELQSCDRLLRDARLPTLSVNRVCGARSPAELQKYIRTRDWVPLNAEVRVTEVHRIIELFGGSLLYGSDATVPLRELIQNAADAVRARRDWRKDTFFSGRIVVSLLQASDNTWRLIVEDNGVGMSKSVLTGPLLEFGKSFWNSEESHLEFPGLTGSNINQSGRYGIGFFSCLMIARSLSVTSRRFDQGYNDTHVLSFRDGLELRPILKRVDGVLLGGISTRVELNLMEKNVRSLLSAGNHLIQATVEVSLKNMISHLCPMIDCDIYSRFQDNPPEISRRKDWFHEPAEDWLNAILYLKEFGDNNINDYIKRAVQFIRNVETPYPSGVNRLAGLL